VSTASSAPLSSTPAASNGAAFTTATYWGDGAWVEVIAALSEDAYVAGFSLGNTTATAMTGIEFATGAAGDEALLTECAFSAPQIAGTAPGNRSAVFLSSPFFVAAGSRLSFRVRTQSAGSWTSALRVMTYPASALASDRRTTAPCRWYPATPQTLTQPSPAWTWTQWYELTAGLAEGGAIDSFVTFNHGGWADVEFGLGAAGAEAVATAIGFNTSGLGTIQNRLPAPFPVAAATRVAFRLRSATTGYTIWAAANILGLEPEPPGEIDFDPDSDLTGETVGLTWVEFTDLLGALHVSSKVPLPDPATFYGGWKEGDVIEWGVIRRALSDWKGTYEGTSFTWRLSDAARAWRALLSDPATRVLFNRPVVVRMISDAARREWQE
jgi:hypothetical protein